MGGGTRLLELLRLPSPAEPPTVAATAPAAAATAAAAVTAAAAGGGEGLFRDSVSANCAAVYVLPRCSDSPNNCRYTGDPPPSFYTPPSTPGASPLSLSPRLSPPRARRHSLSPFSSRRGSSSSSSSSCSSSGSSSSSRSVQCNSWGPCCCTSCGVSIYLSLHYPGEGSLCCARWEWGTPQPQQQEHQQQEHEQQQQRQHEPRQERPRRPFTWWQVALPSQVGDGAVVSLRWLELEKGRLALLAGSASGILCLYTCGGVFCVCCSWRPFAILDMQLATSSSSSSGSSCSSGGSSRCSAGVCCSCVDEDCMLLLLLEDSHVAAVGVSALKAAAAAAETRAAKRIGKGRSPQVLEQHLPSVVTKLEGRDATVAAVVAGGAAAADAAAGPRMPHPAAADELQRLLQQLDGSEVQQQQQQQQQVYATSFSSDSGDSRMRRRRRSPSLRPPMQQQHQSVSPQRRHSPSGFRQQQQQQLLLLAAGSDPLLSLHSVHLGDGQEARKFSFFAVTAAAAAGKLAAAAARKAFSLLRLSSGVSAAVEAPLLQCGWDDAQRGAVSLCLCFWDASVAALSDSLGRVSLVSVSSLLPLWMLKGYRSAQLAWLRRPPSQCTDTSAAAAAEQPPSGGLLVLAPKRGTQSGALSQVSPPGIKDANADVLMSASNTRAAAAAAVALAAAVAAGGVAYYLLRAQRHSLSSGQEKKGFRNASSDASTRGSNGDRTDSSDSSPSRSSSSSIAVYIHFGSETGTAEGISEQLAARLGGPPLRLPVFVGDLEDFTPAEFLGVYPHSTGGLERAAPRGLEGPLPVRVLVVATHGEGDATDSARRFECWLLGYNKWLRQLHLQAVHRKDFAAALTLLKQRHAAVQQEQQQERQQEQQQEQQQEVVQQEPVFLWGVFAVLGLCSSNYPSTFNAMGSRTRRSLVKACCMQQQLAQLVADSSSSSSSGGGAEEELVQLLQQLLPPRQPEVVGALGVCDDTKGTEAAAHHWTEKQLLPALRQLLLQHSSSSSCGSTKQETTDAQTQRGLTDGAAAAAAPAPAASAAAEGEGMEAVRSWLAQHKAPTVVKLTAAELAGLSQTPKQRPGSTSSRFFFSMESLPLLRSTNLLQQTKRPKAAAAARDDEETECRELTFDLSEAPGLRCHTADTLYVLPRNKKDEVVLWWYEALGFAKRGLALGDTIHFLEETVPFPTPCTVEDALALYCSFEVPSSKSDLSIFALVATDVEQKRQWLRLTTDPTQGDRFAAAIREQGWCLRGLLAALLPSVDFAAADLGLLLLLLSRHRIPRAYTISSSHLQQPQQQGSLRSVSICLDRHRARRKEPQQLLLLLQQHGIRVFGSPETIPSGFYDGVCSSYLLGLRPGSQGPPKGAPTQPSPVAALCCCRPSSFKLPADPETPMILVAAGTGEETLVLGCVLGIAPFAAFVRHLAATGGARAEVCLFFGCRDTRHFLYRDLLLAHLDPTQQQQQDVERLQRQHQHQQRQKPRVLSHLYLAFSRADPKRKVYVQHKIAEESEHVWRLLNSGATVYVCGKPALGKAVHSSVHSVVTAHVGASRAEVFIKRMHEDRLYIEEVWE
ncbi:hypothetical protein Esti_002895 [Eimeria stiedai]